MNSKAKKILSNSVKAVAWILVVFTVFIMLFTIVTVLTVDKHDRSIFGLKFYIVRTDSMSKSEKNEHMDVHFNAGDIIIAKNVKDKTALQAGDVISFISPNSDSFGETITHMIRSVEKNKDGKVIAYNTFGTSKDSDDEKPVEVDYVLGEYVGKLPGVGHFFAFLKTTPGYILCILIPFLLLILYNGVNVIRLFRAYKKEQTAILNAEKAELAEERKQNEEMLRELMALKAELEKQKEGEQPPTASEENSEDN